MTYNIDNIKIDLQTVDFDATPGLRDLVESELRRIMRFRSDIVAADIYLHEDGHDPTKNKVVRWRWVFRVKTCLPKQPEKSWGAGLRATSEKLADSLSTNTAGKHGVDLNFLLPEST